MNIPEILSFSYQEILISRKLIQSRKHLIEYIKMLSEKYKYPANKIIFNHDIEDNGENNLSFIDNFKLKGNYDYLKEGLKK